MYMCQPRVKISGGEQRRESYPIAQEEIMNTVGIDVLKGKSIMAVRRSTGEVALLSKEYPHTEVGLEQMALGEDTRAVMEATGRHHEPTTEQ